LGEEAPGRSRGTRTRSAPARIVHGTPIVHSTAARLTAATAGTHRRPAAAQVGSAGRAGTVSPGYDLGRARR
jgi:hypothetical protein